MPGANRPNNKKSGGTLASLKAQVKNKNSTSKKKSTSSKKKQPSDGAVAAKIKEWEGYGYEFSDADKALATKDWESFRQLARKKYDYKHADELATAGNSSYGKMTADEIRQKAHEGAQAIRVKNNYVADKGGQNTFTLSTEGEKQAYNIYQKYLSGQKDQKNAPGFAEWALQNQQILSKPTEADAQSWAANTTMAKQAAADAAAQTESAQVVRALKKKWEKERDANMAAAKEQGVAYRGPSWQEYYDSHIESYIDAYEKKQKAEQAAMARQAAARESYGKRVQMQTTPLFKASTKNGNLLAQMKAGIK